MRYPASDKMEIIHLVENSSLSVRRTLATIGVSKSTFYAWLDRYASGGFDALEDRFTDASTRLRVSRTEQF